MLIHICYYETEYYLTLGIIWQTALHQAETLCKLNEGQHGSRSLRNAVDPVFIEELRWFDIAWLTRKMLVQTNYNATSCYDPFPNLTMLNSRQHGVSKMTTLTNAKTLERAEYWICTKLGVSTMGYTHVETNPIYGTGSRNSPMIWCFLSSVILNCRYDEASRAKSKILPSRNWYDWIYLWQ